MSQLLLWRLWQVLRRQYSNDPIYHKVQGRGYTVPHVLEAGFVWTLFISRAVSREHERETFDLLAVTPGGALGAGVMMSAGVMHKLVEVTQYMGLVVWIVRFLVVGVWLGTTAAMTDTPSGFCLLWVGVAIPVVALGMLHYYDIALAGLLGVLFPSLTRERTATPFFATGLHLLLLMVPILQALVGYSWLLSVSTNTWVFLLGNALNVLLMVLLCEGVARLLWGRLLTALDVSPVDASKVLSQR